MAVKEVDALGEAIAATEQELFSGAFGTDDPVLDETGDRSPEEIGEGLEGRGEDEIKDDALEAPEKDAEGEESDDADGEDKPRGKDGKFVAKDEAGGTDKDAETPDTDKAADRIADGKVPPGRLREQTERAKAAEAERDAAKAEASAVRDEVKALHARLDGMLAVIQQRSVPAKDPPKAETPPDLFEDPKGFADHLQKGFQTELSKRDQLFEQYRIESSMQIAAGIHKDVFAKAYEAVGRLDRNSPDDQMTVRRIWNSPNPGEALVRWHRNQETLREVGDDPAKFKERIANETRERLMKDPEFRKQLLDGLREEAEGVADGKPRTAVKLLKSLNGAAGGRSAQQIDPALQDQSDGALFARAYGISDA